jgi:hypothetical protein
MDKFASQTWGYSKGVSEAELVVPFKSHTCLCYRPLDIVFFVLFQSLFVNGPLNAFFNYFFAILHYELVHF